MGGLAVAVVLGVVAVFAWRGDPEAAQPDTPESAVPYICLKCGHVFDLTPAGYEELTYDGGIKAPSNRQSASPALLRCPECKELASVGAYACPNDGTMIPGRQADGTPGRCPKCGWSRYR